MIATLTPWYTGIQPIFVWMKLKGNNITPYYLP